jgi:hypothetical protein
VLSQGWCAAVGVPVPTPHWLQELLLGRYDDESRGSQDAMSLVSILLSMEVSEIDRRFHEDIMRGRGQWWKNPDTKPLSFLTLWKMLEHRTKDVCTFHIRIHFYLNILLLLSLRRAV